jgi:aspartate aminotransferase
MNEHPFRAASRLSDITVSPILALSQRARELRREGRDIIDLTVGEPDFDTPDTIKAAAKLAIDQGQTKYTALNGSAELVSAITWRMTARGMRVGAGQVITSSGAKQVIHNALDATLDPRDEVVLPAPYWTSYADMIRLCGGRPVAAPGHWCPRRGWRVDAKAIGAAITPHTRWLFLNSPNNPTGSAMDHAELDQIAEILREHPHVWLLCDDIYEDLLYQGEIRAPFPVLHPDLASRTLVVSGASKAYAMTGWRIGWGVGPARLIAAMSTVQSQTTSAPCSISQAAAVAALTGPQDRVGTMVAAFMSRRDELVGLLNAIPGVECPSPDGAFYVFPRVERLLGARTPQGATLKSDLDLSAYLLDIAGVATVPGSVFGGPGHLRLSFAAAPAALRDACQRIAAACGDLAQAPVGRSANA